MKYDCNNKERIGILDELINCRNWMIVGGFKVGKIIGFHKTVYPSVSSIN